MSACFFPCQESGKQNTTQTLILLLNVFMENDYCYNIKQRRVELYPLFRFRILQVHDALTLQKPTGLSALRVCTPLIQSQTVANTGIFLHAVLM